MIIIWASGPEIIAKVARRLETNKKYKKQQ